MKKLNNKILILLSLLILSGIIFTGTSVANASPVTESVVISSGISKQTLREARLNAEALVLGKTVNDLRNILKTHKLSQVIKQEGFTIKTFREEVRNQVFNNLLDKGYTATQITNALSSNYIKTHTNNF